MRLHFTFAIITALLLVLTLRGGDKHRFSFTQVEKIAEQRAHKEYVPLPNALPPQLQNLSPQQESGIFWKDAFRLWRKYGLPFQVDFYHISREFPSGPRINTVDRKGSHALVYSPTFFDFGGLNLNPPLPTTLPFAGFYLRYPLPTATEPKPNLLNGFFTTQGASYFRVLAQDQVYGLSARAIAGKLAEYGRLPEGVAAIRNLMGVAKLLTVIDPDVLLALTKSLESANALHQQEYNPPGLFTLARRAVSTDSRRALSLLTLILGEVGRSLNTGEHNQGRVDPSEPITAG